MCLRREALEDSPRAFASSPATDFASSVEQVRDLLAGPSIIIGGFEDERLAGIVGLLRGRHEKSRHKIHLWGMYVAPQYRRSGLGRSLLEVALDHAREMPDAASVQLGVTSAAVSARRLYERLGFTVWGTEPDALRVDGESIVEYHMALRL